ncbi:MAG: 2-amino-4-hydroxy-6-hydroxymethyldihydropteridine diphosphokinase [Chloroflexi bacterium]|nr:MAG: 2-amino-4-hydroxy-6-hydroxymethyldihydropteridine diphosphokinase [Chloroflexota bacterium]
MNLVALSFGSNIDKERNLPEAVRLLHEMTELVEIIAVAPVYETAPTGLLNQPNFFNTAVLIHTPLSATEVKETIINRIETQLKRVRQADKNAPRTIDIDIVLFNDDVFNYELSDGSTRHVPDKDILRFPHVAVPLADLLPDMLHPETGERLSAITTRLLAEIIPGTIWSRPDIQLPGSDMK